MNPANAPGARTWTTARLTPRQADWLVVGVVLALSLSTLIHARMVGRPVGIGLATLPLSTVPLLWRRSHPGPVLAVLAAAFAVPAIFGNPAEPNSVGLLVGVGSAALYGNSRLRHVTGAAAVGALLLAFAIILITGEVRTLDHLTGIAFGSG